MKRLLFEGIGIQSILRFLSSTCTKNQSRSHINYHEGIYRNEYVEKWLLLCGLLL